MNKAIKMHLENITIENLMLWRTRNAYSSFASSTGKNGHVDLGVNGNGDYVVRYRITGETKEEEYFSSAEKAIERYIELVSD